MTTNRMHLAVVNTVRQAMRFAYNLHAFIPSFSNDWGFCVASAEVDARALTAEEVDRRVAQRVEGGLQFYSGATHQAMLALPPWYARAQADSDTVIDDDIALPPTLFNTAD
jgi:spermidine synthase